MLGSYIQEVIGSYLGLNVTQVLLLAVLVFLIMIFVFRR